MKRGIWRWLAVLAVAFGVALEVVPPSAQAKEVSHSGTSGTVSWTLYDDGELHFEPANGTEGTFADVNWSHGESELWPWTSFVLSVKSVTSGGAIHGSSNMSYMFYGCKNLSDIDGLSSWDVSGTTDMSDMFLFCSSITNLNALASWHTGSLTNMTDMFSECMSLSDIDGVANWDVSHVTAMSSSGWTGLFCADPITNVDALSSWNTSRLTTMEYLFSQCTSLTNIDGLRSWDTSHVTDFREAFYGCTSLIDASGIANWNLSDASDLGFLFVDCSSLAKVDMSGWDFRRFGTKSWPFNGIFEHCSNLSTVVIGPNVTSALVAKLPTPPSAYPYTGLWVRGDSAYGPYPVSDLASNWSPAMSGTWVWEMDANVVSFDPNGGMGSMASVRTISSVTLPSSTFLRLGYRFSGWNTAADGSGTPYADRASVTPSGNMTLYAQWVPTSRTGTMGSEFDVTLHAGEQVTIDNLPAGASYVVTEILVPKGWTLVRSQDATGVILPSV